MNERVGYWIDRRNDSTKFWLVWISPQKRDLDIKKGDSLQFLLKGGGVLTLSTYQHVDLHTNLFSSVVNAPFLVNKQAALVLQSDDLVQVRIFHQQGVLEFTVRESQQSSVRKAMKLFNYP